jgi:tetratricopeptide (TPR) repeat protein
MAYKQPKQPMQSETEMFGQRTISRAEQIGNAFDDILKYLDAFPESEEGILEAGKIQILRGQYKDAVEYLKRFIDLLPKDARGPYYLGMVYLMMNNPKQAKILFASCQKVDPLFVSGLVQLGGLELMNEKDDEKALRYFDEVLAIDSMQWTARFFRYSILSRKRKADKAIADVNFLVRLNPTNWRIRLLRAGTLIEMESYKEAFSDLRIVMENTRLDEANYVGKRQPVRRWLDIQSLGTYLIRHIYGLPDEDAAALRKAFCLLVVEKYKECTASLDDRKSLADQPTATYLSAVANEYGDKMDAAEKLYIKAARLDPELFDVHKKCAFILVNSGKWQESLPYLNQLERLNPKYLGTYSIRGLAFKNLEEYSKAIADFSTYLLMDSLSEEVYTNRGICYQQLGNLLPAIQDITRAHNYRALSFQSIHEEVDQLLLKGDTASLRVYSNLIMKIPSMAGLGTDLEIIKVKLMHLDRDWKFISDRYGKLVLTRGEGDNEDYISCTVSAQASYLVEKGEFKEASALFDKAIDFDNHNAIAYLERAKLMLKMNEQDKAIDDLKRAAQFGDQRAKALRNQLLNRR